MVKVILLHLISKKDPDQLLNWIPTNDMSHATPNLQTIPKAN